MGIGLRGSVVPKPLECELGMEMAAQRALVHKGDRTNKQLTMNCSPQLAPGIREGKLKALRAPAPPPPSTS